MPCRPVYSLPTYPALGLTANPARARKGRGHPVKTLAMVFLSAAFAVAASAGPRTYQMGTILAFDTGQQLEKNAKRARGEIVYQVQIQSVIYKVTNHSKKREFSAGDQVACYVAKNRLFVQKSKGGEVKFDILGESVQPQRAPGANPYP